jgi:hypothetical protein
MGTGPRCGPVLFLGVVRGRLLHRQRLLVPGSTGLAGQFVFLAARPRGRDPVRGARPRRPIYARTSRPCRWKSRPRSARAVGTGPLCGPVFFLGVGCGRLLPGGVCVTPPTCRPPPVPFTCRLAPPPPPPRRAVGGVPGTGQALPAPCPPRGAPCSPGRCETVPHDRAELLPWRKAAIQTVPRRQWVRGLRCDRSFVSVRSAGAVEA